MRRFRLIRFRLTLTYTLLLTGGFTLFSVGMFFGLHQVLYSNFYDRIDNAADNVVKSTRIVAQYAGPYQIRLKVDSETISGDPNPSTTKYILLDANGRPISGDQKGDPKLASLAKDPKVKNLINTSLIQGSKQRTTLSGKNGDTNLLVVPSTTGAEDYVLLVQSSLKEVDDTLSLLEHILIVTAFAVTVLSAAGAWFLTGRVLRPIDQMTAKVRNITARDLSQRLNLNQPDEFGRLAGTFDNMIGRLQASFERQKRFTSDASHELRTPLTVMQADISLALKRPRSTVEYRATLESVQEEVTRLSRIVSDLLTLSRLDIDSALIAHEPIMLDELIDDVVCRLRPLATEKAIALRFAADGAVAITGDNTRLKQMFFNLLDNAIVYTPEGGAVYVDLQHSAELVQVTVSDTGIGIDPQHLPHIFERFYRADEARACHHEGTGLGLAIAQSAAQAHRGRIDVSSEVGRGTTFRVLLPRSGALAGQGDTGRLPMLALVPAAGS